MREQQKSRQEEYAEQIAQELIERLQQGTAPFQRLWEPSMGRDFPHNPVSGNEYSGLNVLRLMLQGRSDPRWMTYKQAASVNAQVRKGEHGVGLVRLITHVERIKKDEHGKTVRDENGEPVKERHALEQPYFKGFTVFNAEQIDGLPELKQPEPVWEDHQRAEKLLAASGAVIRHGGNDAYYSPKRDEIVLPPKDRFDGQGEYYAVALHELGHWSGHESRLNRDLSGRFGSEAYAREELRAEIASLMLTRELGLPHNPDRHAHYVGSWVKVLSEEPMEILKATQDAGRIKAFVLGFEQQIETERKEPQRRPKAERPSENPVLTAPDAVRHLTDKLTAAGFAASHEYHQDGRERHFTYSFDDKGKAWMTVYMVRDYRQGEMPLYAESFMTDNGKSGTVAKLEWDGKTEGLGKALDAFFGQIESRRAMEAAGRLSVAEKEPPSLPERLQTAKQAYERLLAGGNDTDRKLGRFMEAGMEQLIKGLPEQTQLQVRVNFYENLLSRINGKGEPERTPEQQELFAER